jgi:hypothetical protein
MRFYIPVLLLIIFNACTIDTRYPNNNGNIFAYVPIYALPNEIEQIATQAPTPTINAGKIYAYGNYIFQNDLYKGYHIINNTNPANAQKIAFLKVPFSTEIAIKGGYLYCNNVSDLLVFDISNPANPVLTKRVKNAFPLIEQNYPPISNVYFECVDNTKGVVIGWEQKDIPIPACKR